MHFELDTRLKADTHRLGNHGDSVVLLMNNTYYPWFILVPHTQETEFYRLDRAHQQRLLIAINGLCEFIEETYRVDKVNIATIGNLVSQLHIHVVGRFHDDPCWPGVVWGGKQTRAYDAATVSRLRQQLADSLGSDFSPGNDA